MATHSSSQKRRKTASSSRSKSNRRSQSGSSSMRTSSSRSSIRSKSRSGSTSGKSSGSLPSTKLSEGHRRKSEIDKEFQQLFETASTFFTDKVYKGKLREKFLKSVKRLLDAGANVNIPDKNGDTPLIFSIIIRDLDLAKLLVKYGANVNYKNNKNEGRTPLYYVVDSKGSDNNLEIVKFLLKSGARVVNSQNDVSLFYFTAEVDKFEIFKELFKYHPDPNIILPFNENSILQEAVMNSNIKLVKFLVKHGADVNYVDRVGHTAFFYARNKNVKIIQSLFEANIDMTINANKKALDIFFRRLHNRLRKIYDDNAEETVEDINSTIETIIKNTDYASDEAINMLRDAMMKANVKRSIMISPENEELLTKLFEQNRLHHEYKPPSRQTDTWRQEKGVGYLLPPRGGKGYHETQRRWETRQKACYVTDEKSWEEFVNVVLSVQKLKNIPKPVLMKMNLSLPNPVVKQDDYEDISKLGMAKKLMQKFNEYEELKSVGCIPRELVKVFWYLFGTPEGRRRPGSKVTLSQYPEPVLRQTTRKRKRSSSSSGLSRSAKRTKRSS